MSLHDIATVLCGLAIAVGVLGTIIPVLPGASLIAIAVLVWAIVVQTTGGWVVLGVVLALLAAGEIVKYVTAGKRMVSSGVPNSSLIIAGLAGIVGFFVIPVLGLAIGFVAALTLTEYLRQREWDATWASTKQALVAVGLIMLIEMGPAMLSGLTWAIGVWRGAAG